MNETFEASNGVPVRRTTAGILSFTRNCSYDFGTLTGISVLQEEALREFFQHERDQELGRWRWPENPEYVVYEDKARCYINQPAVIVFNENDGASAMCGRDGLYSASGIGARDKWCEPAAKAYFDAHPEPKHIPTEPGSVLQGTGPNRTILHRGYPVHGRESDRPWTALGGATYADEDVHGFFHGQFVQLIPKEES